MAHTPPSSGVPRGHPSPELLAAFRLGRLDAAILVNVGAHLTACPSCSRALESLPDDTLLSVMRQPAVPETIAGHHPLSPTEAGPDLPPALAAHPRYRVLKLLGRGGMGAVYQAEHRLMQRLVALKVIDRRLTADVASVDRFQREVIAAARLNHPNIVTAFDAEQVGDVHFLVMEFVDGTSLAAEVAHHGRLPVARACRFATQAALGLQHAFLCGMVHRDIKPQNLMLTSQGRVKILDFGLARFVRESTAGGEITREGTLMGTPDYMAPEQAADPRSADIRADVYSLGCTLYRLLSGHVPFPGGTLVQKVLAHREVAPRPLRDLCPDVPGELAAVVGRMMAKHPSHRYQTPADVVTALAPFTGDVRAIPAAAPSEAPDWASITDEAAAGQVPPSPPPVKKPSPVLFVAGAGVLCVIGLILGLVLTFALGGKEPTHAEQPTSGQTRPAGPPSVAGKKLVWPPDLLRQGKITPPDMSGKKILFNESFSNPSKGFRVGGMGGVDGNKAVIANGVYEIRTPTGPGSWWWWDFPGGTVYPDSFAFQVTFRLTGPRSEGGFVLIRNDFRVIRLTTNSDGQMEVLRFLTDTEPWTIDPSFKETFAHPAIKPHGEKNVLFVLVRKRQLEVYFNQSAVHDPWLLEGDQLPARLGYGLKGGARGAEFAIEQITLWSAEGVPPPEARGAVWN